MATFAAMLGIGIIAPILPIYAKDMGAGVVMIGLIFAVFALARGIFAPIIGNFSDKHGRKKIILIGLIFYILLSLAYIVSDTPTLLLVVRFLQGITSVMITTVAQSYIGDITPKHKEGSYPNLFSISLFSGMALGPTMGGFLTDSISIQAPFYAMAITGVISFFLILALVPKQSKLPKKQQRKLVKIPHAFMRTIKDHSMRGIMIYSVTRGFARWGFNAFFPLFAIEALSLNTTEIGIFLSLYMLTGAVLQYPSGLLSDKFPHHRENLILIGGVLATIPLFIIPFISDKILVLILMMFMGGFSVLARAASIAIRTERGRVFGMGTTSGVFTTSVSAGQVLGPISFGALSVFFSLPIVFVIGAAIRVIGSVVAFRYLRKGFTTRAISANTNN